MDRGGQQGGRERDPTPTHTHAIAPPLSRVVVSGRFRQAVSPHTHTNSWMAMMDGSCLCVWGHTSILSVRVGGHKGGTPTIFLCNMGHRTD
mmetsp:Transcript_4064/g.10445  ORF Transcript_4064/g.10445 Transcript_4064/m.10445 type:complete len:91 (+) Transcript_4064:308-580(+)